MERAGRILAAAVTATVTAWLAAPTPADAQCGPNFVELFNPEIDRFECVPSVRSLQEQTQRQQQAEQLKVLRRQEQDARNQSINQQRQIRKQQALQRQLLRKQQQLQAQ